MGSYALAERVVLSNRGSRWTSRLGEAVADRRARPGSELHTHAALDVVTVILGLYSLELRISRAEEPIAGE